MKSESVTRKGWEWASVSSPLVVVAVPWLLAASLSACSNMKSKDADQSAALATPPVVAASAPASAVEEPVVKKPSVAEMALADGVQAYKAGQYRMAETQLKTALQGGLTAPADQASANKYLAFIYCTSKRYALCTSAFKAAKDADPSFALSKAEAGHPMWAKTYKKAMGLK